MEKTGTVAGFSYTESNMQRYHIVHFVYFYWRFSIKKRKFCPIKNRILVNNKRVYDNNSKWINNIFVN